MGCGNMNGYYYMISFQFLFAIIIINLFVAVILEGYEDSSRLEDANLSEFYIEKFKKSWGKYDPQATSLIKTTNLIDLLVDVDLPFEQTNLAITAMKMYLPVI